jgi:hypothetical protein
MIDDPGRHHRPSTQRTRAVVVVGSTAASVARALAHLIIYLRVDRAAAGDLVNGIIDVSRRQKWARAGSGVWLHLTARTTTTATSAASVRSRLESQIVASITRTRQQGKRPSQRMHMQRQRSDEALHGTKR